MLNTEEENVVDPDIFEDDADSTDTEDLDEEASEDDENFMDEPEDEDDDGGDLLVDSYDDRSPDF